MAEAREELDGSSSATGDANGAPETSILEGAPSVGSQQDAESGAGAAVDATVDSGPDALAVDAAADSDGPTLGPDDLPSTDVCLTGGHVLWVQGDPGCFWFAGTQNDGVGSYWSVEAEEYYATYDGALLEVKPPASADAGAASWYFNFNTWNMKTPMTTGVVYDALAVTGGYFVGYAQTCTTAYGSFRVDEFRATGGDAAVGGVSTLLGFTAAFSVTCDGTPGVLRGCIHF
jgi:hypothetical protein